MNRLLQTIANLLLITLVSVIFSRSIQAQVTFNLASDPWPPYVLDDKSNFSQKGIAIELLQAIFKEVEGVEVKIPIIPWKRVLKWAENGHMDGVPILLKTPEREKYLTYTDAYLSDRTLLYYNPKRYPKGLTWETLADLKKLQWGVLHDYSYGTSFDDLKNKKVLRLLPFDSTEQALKMLLKDRVDIVPMTERVAKGWIEKNKWTELIAFDPKPIHRDVYHIGLSKKSDIVKYLPQINAAIKKLVEKGVIEKIDR